MSYAPTFFFTGFLVRIILTPAFKEQATDSNGRRLRGGVLRGLHRGRMHRLLRDRGYALLRPRVPPRMRPLLQQLLRLVRGLLRMREQLQQQTPQTAELQLRGDGALLKRRHQQWQQQRHVRPAHRGCARESAAAGIVVLITSWWCRDASVPGASRIPSATADDGDQQRIRTRQPGDESPRWMRVPSSAYERGNELALFGINGLVHRYE